MMQMKDNIGLLYKKTKKIISWRTQEELDEDWIYNILESLLAKTMSFLNHIPVLFLLHPSLIWFLPKKETMLSV